MKTVKDTCSYKEVNVIDEKNDTDTTGNNTKLSGWNLMRQLVVCSTMWTIYFIYGLQMGAPTVLIPQLRKEANSSTLIDDDLASWIVSLFPIGAIPWALILPGILHIFGRKKTYILICFNAFIGALVIYLSKSITQLLVGEFILGIILGSLNTISPFIITEYSSPKYRGIFMTIKSASAYWGMWVANVIGTFLPWKNIYLMVFLCNAYTLTVFIWPESPYWLAKQKRFVDCANVYRKLQGTSRNAEKDLERLINYYKLDEDEQIDYNRKSFKSVLDSSFKLLSRKSYYKPLVLSILLGLQYHFMGKLICSIYAVQLLKKITGNEAVAYKGMIILDGVTVFSGYCGCVVARFSKRRTMLFSTAFLTIMFLYIFALYLFLIHRSIIVENNIISISLLSFFSVTVCSGPMILLSSIYGELISFRYQLSSSLIYGVINSTVMMISLKTSLLVFKTLTLPGTFLFFAISSTVLTFILYLYLPETKNKSVHEIGNHFGGATNVVTNKIPILQPET